MVKHVPIILHASTKTSKILETVVAILKPMKFPGDPKSDRLISLLCIPYKIMERLIYACIKSIIDPMFPQGKHDFDAKDQPLKITLLSRKIEDSCSAKKKAGAVFVDLTAAYHTVWHRGLTSKLLCLLPDRHCLSFVRCNSR